MTKSGKDENKNSNWALNDIFGEIRWSRPLNWITDNGISRLLESDNTGPIVYLNFTQ
jgi:hypothetical protein